MSTQAYKPSGQDNESKIRNCTQEDFHTLCSLDWDPLPKERSSFYLTITTEQAELSFISEDEDGEFLGVLLTTRSADGLSCYLNHLLVESRVRGRGIGAALVERLKGECRSLGIKRIWLITNKGRKAFYERLGFEEDYSFFIPSIRNYIQVEKGKLIMRACL